ncbi:LysR family transcriptional regulator [Stakelama sp. CBK3Z-3]|uniref:LysR family transcriptional regulator n=1 Tax=Stakelama flava TaxID=2860338 RepID=A0ABS6XPI4_9SPHN|nr:LysR substrate-binding domain-containing protein [Stakelama flava]MBW4332124.1 LysR family transcriptional regulator [Stakelama flava]
MKDNVRQRADAISLRQLRLFKSIGELKSVRRASDVCGLSQPAVTQALAKMERQIGAMLVDRGVGGSFLNELGEIFHARVQRCFAQIEEAVIANGLTPGQDEAGAIVNRLTRSQLRTLISIIEHGSFEGGADALGISPASLQRASRDLESNVKLSLFYRTAAGLLVTPAGAEFGRRIKLALQEIIWGIEEIDAMRGETSRQIVIGAMPFGGSVLLASVLDEFLQLHPKADIRIVSDSAAEMAKSLRAGDVDLMIGLLPELDGDDLASEALANTPYSVVARRAHPLARKGFLSLDDLAECDWIVGETGSSRRRCFEGLFAEQHAPQTRIATCVTPVIRLLLESSDRLTLMTTFELQYAGDSLRSLPYGPVLPVPSIGVTRRSNWLPTRLHTDFIDILRSHVAEVGRDGEMRRAG